VTAHFDYNLAPLAIAGLVGWVVPDRVAMIYKQGDVLTRVLHQTATGAAIRGIRFVVENLKIFEPVIED
jgi:hypothetical protein